MKSSFIRIAPVLFGVVVAGMANAQTTKTFTPSDNDLGDLDHYKYSTWGIDNVNNGGQVITGATLTISNIYDWKKEEGDILYVQLLNSAPLGVTVHDDNQGGGNAFAGQGVAIGTWTDPVGGVNNGFDLKFDLGALGLLDELNAYAADGRIGLGFDADCHYFNDGVKLTVTTAAVPEPASIATLGIGGLALLRRRKKNAK